MTLTPQEANLARECAALRTEDGAPTEDIIAILVRLVPDFDIVAFRRIAGGRQWYVPSLRRQSMEEAKEAIRRDPCRDYKVVSRRYKVSVALVYEVWNERAG